jgi:hypothetical protein
MTTVYPREYLEEYELIEKMYSDSKNPFAKMERDSYARELRKHGWEVKCKKVSFQDFGYGSSYTLSARRKKQGTLVGGM